MFKHHALTTGICAMVALAMQAQAAVIVTPIAAVSATGNLSNRPIEEAINGNGLSSGGTSGDVLSETHNVNSGNSGEYWIGNLAGAVLTFTLPGASVIDAVHIWNYSRTGETDRGIQSFDISFSSNGVDFLNTIAVTGIAQETYPDPIDVQSTSFAQQTGVTHIRFENIVNHGDGSFTGLSEVRFSGVPEPASLALLGLGGLMMLRRK